MEPDEPRLAGADAITPGGDLTVLGIEQLKDRIRVLSAELERTRAMIERKEAGLAKADSFFRK